MELWFALGLKYAQIVLHLDLKHFIRKCMAFTGFAYTFLISLFSFQLLIGVESATIKADLEKIAREFREDHSIVGMSIAAIGKDGEKNLVTLGDISKKSSIQVNEYTEFRLGALTQIFTAAVLAYFVQEGRVSLDDPISKFVPKSTKLPTYKGKEITLGDLATHTSGLPDMPYTLSSRATFTVSQMYRFLSNYELTKAPGQSVEFSHLGYAVLATILTRISKSSLTELFNQLIQNPLNLHDTTFYFSKEQKKRCAVGYNGEQGISQINSEKIYSVFMGAGGLHSTDQNMLTWLSFHLGKEKTSLNSILPIMQHPYKALGKQKIGLGWNISSLEGVEGDLFYNLGKLYGFTAYMGIIPKTGVGVVVLINQSECELTSLAERILKRLSD